MSHLYMHRGYKGYGFDLKMKLCILSESFNAVRGFGNIKEIIAEEEGVHPNPPPYLHVRSNGFTGSSKLRGFKGLIYSILDFVISFS